MNDVHWLLCIHSRFVTVSLKVRDPIFKHRVPAPGRNSRLALKQP